MGSFQPDKTMMDVVSMNGDMMNSSMGMDVFPNDVPIDLGNQSASMYHQNEPPATLTRESTTKESSDSLGSNNVSGAGAGPLPTGFGVQSAPNTGSTLTEFTKRRNWSQRVLEELKDILYILTPDGRLLYVSPSAKLLTGHDPKDLTGKLICDFIHSDDSSLFIREFNESIATGHTLRFFYRFRTAEDKYIVFECHGHPHLTSDPTHLQLANTPINAAGTCRGFFMMARPYPTKNSELLDSFLEHKIENERLQARIAALKREEIEEAQAQARHYHHKKTNGAQGSSVTPEMTPQSPSIPSRDDPADFSSMPPPAKPVISITALTREALDEANAFSSPDSITDKMARYEGSSHVDSIEMFTGLRYREGERAHGISTGATSPALIRGDAGIDIPADKSDPRHISSMGYLDKKPKRLKSADEYVCTDCGTLDSPEWRKGPMGPKTLCNACGLRWAKREKKKTSPGGERTRDDGALGIGETTVQTAHGSGLPGLGHGDEMG